MAGGGSGIILGVRRSGRSGAFGAASSAVLPSAGGLGKLHIPTALHEAAWTDRNPPKTTATLSLRAGTPPPAARTDT